MLSLRLYLENDDRIAGLNIYSTKPDAFDEHAEMVGTLLATHGSLAVTAAIDRAEATNLRRALINSRDIGTAMGVLMATYKVTRDEAFDLLRITSQRSNRKLIDIAADVNLAGGLTSGA
jgi:AmiR/NasT family two-component response regulator